MTRSSDDIAALFAERLPATGGGLTRKQLAWLFDVAAKEAIDRGDPVVPTREVTGRLADGRFWTAIRYPNGAGNLKLTLPGESHADWTDRANRLAATR